MNLDDIYKTRIGESHEAALQAVYDFALAQAAQAFVAQVVAPTAPTDVIIVPPADAVVQ
jgi:hypothetical protein